MSQGLGLVIVAAGSATRMAGIDKVWAKLGPTTIVGHSLLQLAPAVDRVVVVVHKDRVDVAKQELRQIISGVEVVAGGGRRQDSVKYGLDALEGMQHVAIHDAARPFATEVLLRQGLSFMNQYPGATPGIAITDSVKLVDEGEVVVQSVDRAPLRAVQTPQVFHFDTVYGCHQEATRLSFDGTDDAALLQLCGHSVRVFPGEASNFKITTAHDLEFAQLMLAMGGR